MPALRALVRVRIGVRARIRARVRCLPGRQGGKLWLGLGLGPKGLELMMRGLGIGLGLNCRRESAILIMAVLTMAVPWRVRGHGYA